MNILADIQSRGAGVSLDDSGKLELDLSRVRAGDRAAVVAIAKQNKQAIIDALKGGPAGLPAHIISALALGGYDDNLAEWTPPACQCFLSQLVQEWPAFKVNGWYGLTMPDNWPGEFMDAVQSIYIHAMQEKTI